MVNGIEEQKAKGHPRHRLKKEYDHRLRLADATPKKWAQREQALRMLATAPTGGELQEDPRDKLPRGTGGSTLFQIADVQGV